MKKSWGRGLVFVVGVWLGLVSPVAAANHFWVISSPNQAQTFAYGTLQNRAWGFVGSDRHLVLYLNFTNDPYVDINNPRQWDNFTFHFPKVKLGSDGSTFYYRTAGGRSIPVAERHPGFLGIPQIRLLSNAALNIEKPHGLVNVSISLVDPQTMSGSE